MLPRTSEAAVSVYVCLDSHHTICVVTDWELGYMVNEINIDLRKELVADWQNPSECLCQTWRNFTKVFLRYRVRNGKDGRTTRGKKRKPAINPSNNSACCGLNSSYSSLLVALDSSLGEMGKSWIWHKNHQCWSLGSQRLTCLSWKLRSSEFGLSPDNGSRSLESALSRSKHDFYKILSTGDLKKKWNSWYYHVDSW